MTEPKEIDLMKALVTSLNPPSSQSLTPAPKWITFREIPASGVTKRWEIVANQGGAVIGWIAWSNGWRRYVLQPDMMTEWEEDCLRDVAAFLEQQTATRKRERTQARARAIANSSEDPTNV